VLGFAAARWRRAWSLDSLDEWGLGGRSLGTLIASVPHRRRCLHRLRLHRGARDPVRRQRRRLLRGHERDRGLPVDLPVLPRLWPVSHRHGYATPADFVEGRYDSRPLAVAVTVTGMLATMPYIARRRQ
jgi:SSS family solute:Na+ symporter